MPKIFSKGNSSLSRFGCNAAKECISRHNVQILACFGQLAYWRIIDLRADQNKLDVEHYEERYNRFPIIGIIRQIWILLIFSAFIGYSIYCLLIYLVRKLAKNWKIINLQHFCGFLSSLRHQVTFLEQLVYVWRIIQLSNQFTLKIILNIEVNYSSVQWNEKNQLWRGLLGTS